MAVNPAQHPQQQHFWFGQWLAPNLLDEKLARLDAHIAATLAQPFPLDDLLEAAQHIADDLTNRGATWQRLLALAQQNTGAEEAVRLLDGAAAALQRDALIARLRGELGETRPADLERRYPGRQFEAWLPMGCVVHVMPSNVFLVAALGLIESLLAGNLNIVKLSARDSDFAAVFAEALCAADPGGRLHEYVAILRFASSETHTLEALFAHADAISAWGGETAIESIRHMAPQGVRVITWGHKLSFGYMAADILADAQARTQALRAFASDICRLDQQACSSPQTLFMECDASGLNAYAAELAESLAQVAPTIPGQAPGMAEQAEITSVSNVVRAETALGLTQVIEDPAGGWRIYVDTRPGLRPSPLFRSIWLKPIQRDELIRTLRPMRTWLQTCGLACGVTSLAPLTHALFAAGVTRITRPGEMTDSYTGAPHDGVYALQQFTRRVSLDAPESARFIGSLAQLESRHAASRSAARAPQAPIMTKLDFQELVAPTPPDLVFRSGGSSGTPVFSTFSWPDYHAQMFAAVHGLLAAGLEPESDRVMNLFLVGHMYGSFISFWTMLERLGVRVVPMAMSNDFVEIADAIVQLRVNTLVGSASHIMALFDHEGDRLRGIVEKVFYGGENLSRARRERLQTHFGVSVVRSAAYGSNDAGPIGYQCTHCSGSVHHVFESVQHMEIVALEEDRPVKPGETGRILLTTSPLLRAQPRIVRYDIGDTGRWLEEPCPCGRTDKRFELQGRSSDVFKAGGPNFNARRFTDILDTQLGYAGPVQIHLLEDGIDTVIELWIGEGFGVTEDEAVSVIRAHYPELDLWCTTGAAFQFRARTKPDHEFVRIPTSGKLKSICDHRNPS